MSPADRRMNLVRGPRRMPCGFLGLLPVFEQQFDNRPESLMARALLNRALNKTELATRLAMEALVADPSYDIPFRWLLDQYRRNKDSKSALLVCNLVREHIDKLPLERQYDLESHRGQIAMALGDYTQADGAYTTTISYLLKKQKKGEQKEKTKDSYIYISFHVLFSFLLLLFSFLRIKRN